MLASVSDRIIGWLEERQLEEKGTNIEVKMDTDMLESGLLDSLDFLNLLTFIEEEYDIEIPVELLTPENFSTPKIAGSMVEEMLADQ